MVSAVLSGALVWAIGVWFPNEPETMPFDVNYLYGIAAGVLACILGRSRRAAFIGGAMGIILADVAQGIMNWANGIDQTLVLGGAGGFDAIVISAFTAVLLRELVGEAQERMTRETGEPQRVFEDGEIHQAVLGANREDEDEHPEEFSGDEYLYDDEMEEQQDERH